jgi:hypothetical protein
VIGFHQSTSRLGGLTTTTTSPACPGFDGIGSAEAPGPVTDIGTGSLSLGGVLDAGIGPPSLGESPGECAGVSSSSQIEGLNR